MDIAILVRSSSRDEPYTVLVSSAESALAIYCDCPAGEWGKFCKHKMAVVLGDETILYDDEQRDKFTIISEWMSNSRYPDLVKALRQSEKHLEEAKKSVKNQKEEIARFMREGSE